MRKFYNAEASTTDIYKIYQMGKDINSGNYTTAGDILSTFTPADTIDQNYKTVDSIFLATIAVGVDTLDSLMFVKLYNIAYQCPDIGGLAVYDARSMLNLLTNSEWEFSDSCTTSTGREDKRAIKPSSKTPPTIVNSGAIVYPNPANSMLNVEVQLPQGEAFNICLYNSLGEKVICNELNSNLTIVGISALTPGIYYYRITDEKSSLIKADKVMIIR